MDIAPVDAVAQAVVQSNCGWEAASALGTIGATAVALFFGFFQWFKDRARQRDVRAALARALVADLDAWRDVVATHMSDFDNEDNKPLQSEPWLKAWVHELQDPTMPTHKHFHMMFPDLGRTVSTTVVHAYAEAMRVGDWIGSKTRSPAITDRSYSEIAKNLRHQLDQLHADLESAAAKLRPYALKAVPDAV
ncbi:MAG: hypothetical protein ABW154_07750 [Dyella sp.]